jgi:hypothetical protein
VRFDNPVAESARSLLKREHLSAYPFNAWAEGRLTVLAWITRSADAVGIPASATSPPSPGRSYIINTRQIRLCDQRGRPTGEPQSLRPSQELLLWK